MPCLPPAVTGAMLGAGVMALAVTGVLGKIDPEVGLVIMVALPVSISMGPGCSHNHHLAMVADTAVVKLCVLAPLLQPPSLPPFFVRMDLDLTMPACVLPSACHVHQGALHPPHTHATRCSLICHLRSLFLISAACRRCLCGQTAWRRSSPWHHTS